MGEKEYERTKRTTKRIEIDKWRALIHMEVVHEHSIFLSTVLIELTDRRREDDYIIVYV